MHVVLRSTYGLPSSLRSHRSSSIARAALQPYSLLLAKLLETPQCWKGDIVRQAADIYVQKIGCLSLFGLPIVLRDLEEKLAIAFPGALS